MTECNLVLVAWNRGAGTVSSLKRIAAAVEQIDKSVSARLVAFDSFSAQLRLLPLWFKPTLSLSLRHVPTRRLFPGRFLSGVHLDKHGEYARLEAAGIPVPKWTIIKHGQRFDPADWGPYLVEKPSAGGRAACVRIRKTGRIRHTPQEDYPEGHPGRLGPMLAQQFVYTGPWPTSYRVVTMFAEVLLCYRQTTRSHGHPLQSRFDFRATGGISIASNTKDMAAEIADDPDVIELAERAHRLAFRNFPVLAFDIVRDADTGELFVLECHAQGYWFHNTSALGIAATNNLDFEGQFGATEKAARILARETPRLAKISFPFSDDRKVDLGLQGT